jgi:hypothetical protein
VDEVTLGGMNIMKAVGEVGMLVKEVNSINITNFVVL